MRKYKHLDKVVIRKDLEVGEQYGGVYWTGNMEVLKKAVYVVIEYVNETRSYMTNYDLFVSDEMIEGLYKDVKKYVWHLDSEDGAYFLNNLLGVDKWTLDETKEIKNGKDMCYMLTEEEARKSPFFDKFKKHDPFEEKLYYILVKGQDWEDRQFLNLEVESSRYFFDNDVETDGFKITFTEKEADEIIGTSSILYKEEC